MRRILESTSQPLSQTVQLSRPPPLPGYWTCSNHAISTAQKLTIVHREPGSTIVFLAQLT